MNEPRKWLKQFTVRPRPIDPCPHGCGKWARIIGVADVVGKDGHKHASTCPVVCQQQQS